MKPALTKISLVVFGLILFIAINRSAGPKVSELQSAYESWLQDYEDALQHSADEHSKPVVKISLNSNYPENQSNWLLISNSKPESTTKVLRLLQLAKEAQFFSDQALVKTNSDAYSLTLDIEEGSHKFSSKFQRKFLEQNVTAMGFTKLFETYYKESEPEMNSITKQ